MASVLPRPIITDAPVPNVIHHNRLLLLPAVLSVLVFAMGFIGRGRRAAHLAAGLDEFILRWGHSPGTPRVFLQPCPCSDRRILDNRLVQARFQPVIYCFEHIALRPERSM